MKARDFNTSPGTDDSHRDLHAFPSLDETKDLRQILRPRGRFILRRPHPHPTLMSIPAADAAAIIAHIDRVTLAEMWRPRAGLPDVAPSVFRRLLVGVDGSDASARALEWTQVLSEECEALHLVSVLGPPPYSYDYGTVDAPSPVHGSYATWNELMEADRTEARRVLEEARGRLQRPGIVVDAEVLSGSPANRICQSATEQDTDLIVVGAHHTGAFERFILGSVSHQVVNRAETSVLVAKNAPKPKRILAPVDGSPQSQAAALTAVALAQRLGSEVTILHAVPGPVHGAPDLSRAAYEKTYREISGMDAEPPETEVGRARFRVVFGDPAKEILRFAKEHDMDLLVMGSRGLGALRSHLLGSVSTPVVHKTDASVLVVKPAGTS